MTASGRRASTTSTVRSFELPSTMTSSSTNDGSRSTTHPMFLASFFAGITTLIRRSSCLVLWPCRPATCFTHNLPQRPDLGLDASQDGPRAVPHGTFPFLRPVATPRPGQLSPDDTRDVEPVRPPLPSPDDGTCILRPASGGPQGVGSVDRPRSVALWCMVSPFRCRGASVGGSFGRSE